MATVPVSQRECRGAGPRMTEGSAKKAGAWGPMSSFWGDPLLGTSSLRPPHHIVILGLDPRTHLRAPWALGSSPRMTMWYGGRRNEVPKRGCAPKSDVGPHAPGSRSSSWWTGRYKIGSGCCAGQPDRARLQRSAIGTPGPMGPIRVFLWIARSARATFGGDEIKPDAGRRSE